MPGTCYLLEDKFQLIIIICYYIFPLLSIEHFILYKLYLFVHMLKFKPCSHFLCLKKKLSGPTFQLIHTIHLPTHFPLFPLR